MSRDPDEYGLFGGDDEEPPRRAVGLVVCFILSGLFWGGLFWLWRLWR